VKKAVRDGAIGEPFLVENRLEGVPAVSLYDNYAAHLREGAELLVRSEDGQRVMQVIDAAFESAATGRSVEVSI